VIFETAIKHTLVKQTTMMKTVLNLSMNWIIDCTVYTTVNDTSEKPFLSRLARCEPSQFCCHSHNLFLSSYLCRIKRKNNSCSVCGHHLQDQTHLLCLASELLRYAIFGTTSSIFDLWSIPWGMARLLGIRGVLSLSQSLERGRVAPPPPYRCFCGKKD